MNECLRHDNPNPTLTANPLSNLFFWWMNPLFKKGYKRRLEESDLFNVCPSDSSKHTGETLRGEWDKECQRAGEEGKGSLLRTLLRVHGVHFMLLGLVTLFEELLKLVQPVLLAQFLDYFTSDSSTSSTEAWLYATGVVLCSAIIAVTHHPYFFSISRLGMRIRVGLCSMMYWKSMRLSNKSMGKSSVGQIVNLISNDVARFDQVVLVFHFVWVGPLQALVAVTYMWYRVGPAVLAPMAVVVLLMLAQALTGRLFLTIRRKTAVHTDKRVKVMNEIISGIRIIKLYCWEKPFGRLVEDLRRQEVRQHHRDKRLKAIHLGSTFAGTQISIFLLVLTLVLSGHEQEIRPDNIFLVIGVVTTLRISCGMFVPMAFQQVAETLVVIKRIQTFLLLEELTKLTNQKPADGPLANGISDGAGDKELENGLEVTNLTAKWEGSITESSTLENITLSVRPGRLMAVIGPVGAGKTSLLMSILGELPVQTGSVSVHGKIAFVSQHPWIFSGSLRQNILFGEPFDKARYDKVIRISALSRDLSILPDGDTTLIGDRGVTLSGGQKARVSLARALYVDADIYLLDDPLAAVDTAVGRHIFNKCVVSYLKDKPRILVTHQLQLLPVADNIVILTEGQVVSQGTYTALSKSGVDFSELLKHQEEETSEMDKGTEKIGDKPDTTVTDNNHMTGTGDKRLRADSVTSDDSLGEDYVPDTVRLPEEEERASGTIDNQVFVGYIKAGVGIFSFVLLLLVFFLAQAIYVIIDWWLARWTNRNEERHSTLEILGQSIDQHNNMTTAASLLTSTETDIPLVDTYFNLYVYASLILAALCFSLARALLFFHLSVRAGENLHNRMFARILRATMAFFDTNPVGRVLNRFSKDTGQIDDRLPLVIFDLFSNALIAISIVIVATILNPWVFIPVLPLVMLFVIIRRYFVQTSRSVKRLEGSTRSPVFSHLSATLDGLHTIRAMHMEQRLQAEFDAHQDLHSEAWFLFLSITRWLSIRLDWLSVVFIACVVYCSVLAADTMDPGFVGLSVVYTISMFGLFQWTIRQSVEAENQMISVERVLQYTRLPIEADLESRPGQKPPDTWPSRGSLEAKGLSLRYSPSLPTVLKDLHFHIKEGEKIGIVGRTGAGKSSLITAFFRLAEPEGELSIDGVSIHSLGLHDLRKVISIIPQDPVLFNGPVRRNLDPFDQYSDSQLWRALDEVQLKEAITANPDNLYMDVKEGGSNFSAGQRQLMCLARAVLGNTRILVIDEATANVDPITDELIQQTIRDKFKSCTVLTIAHRLHTIIDSDRLIVLDAGRLVEMDSPANLLSRGKGSLFYSMVEQLGATELEHLTQLANTRKSKLNFNTPSPLWNGVSHLDVPTLEPAVTTKPGSTLETTPKKSELNPPKSTVDSESDPIAATTSEPSESTTGEPSVFPTLEPAVASTIDPQVGIAPEPTAATTSSPPMAITTKSIVAAAPELDIAASHEPTVTTAHAPTVATSPESVVATTPEPTPTCLPKVTLTNVQDAQDSLGVRNEAYIPEITRL